MPIIACDAHRQNCETLLSEFARLDEALHTPDSLAQERIHQLQLLLVVKVIKTTAEFEEIWRLESGFGEEQSRPEARFATGDSTTMWEIHKKVQARSDEVCLDTYQRLMPTIMTLPMPS